MTASDKLIYAFYSKEQQLL